MLKFFIIGLGGGVGAVLRYLVAGGVHALAKTESFPVGTMTVNVTGCLLIGIGGRFFLQASLEVSPPFPHLVWKPSTWPKRDNGWPPWEMWESA